MRRRSQDFDFPPDIMIDEDGAFNLVDGSEEGWPEGMDGHSGDPYDPRSPEQMARDNWRRILDRGNIGGTIDLSKTANQDALGNVSGAKGIEVINCRSDDARKPEPITLQLFELPGSAYAPQNGFYATVEWGVEAFAGSADVDVGLGTLLSLYCSSLKVIMHGDPAVAIAGGRLGATASYGVRPAAGPPTRTLRGDSSVVAGAVGAEVTIPKWARGVYPTPRWSLSASGGNTWGEFVVRQKDSAGTILSQHPYTLGTVSPIRIALLNDARILDLENIDAANSVAMNWIFDLGL